MKLGGSSSQIQSCLVCLALLANSCTTQLASLVSLCCHNSREPNLPPPHPTCRPPPRQRQPTPARPACRLPPRQRQPAPAHPPESAVRLSPPPPPPFIPSSCGRSKAMRWEEVAGSDCSDGEHVDLDQEPRYLAAARRGISPKPQIRRTLPAAGLVAPGGAPPRIRASESAAAAPSARAEAPKPRRRRQRRRRRRRAGDAATADP